MGMVDTLYDLYQRRLEKPSGFAPVSTADLEYGPPAPPPEPPPPTLGSRVMERILGMSGPRAAAEGLNTPEGQILAAIIGGGRMPRPAISKGRLFDTSRKVLEQVPDVPQVDFTEPTWAKGVPQRVIDQRLGGATNMRRLQRDVDAGIERGGLGFYNNEQLGDAFTAELGSKKGPERFQNFMDSVAATSPRSKVPMNARNASYRYWQWMQGEPPPTIDFEPPSPYGHLAQRHHNLHMAELMDEGTFDPLNNPKPMRFSQNLQGNYTPVTVDAHAVKAVGLRDTQGRLMDVPGPAYNYVGNIFRELARRNSIANAQAQSTTWIGAGGRTGLKSSDDPFLKVLEDRIRITAEKEGTSPAKVLRDMIRGNRPLLGIAGAGAALAPLGVPGDLPEN